MNVQMHDPQAPPTQSPEAIILAAGKGTRMESDLPKVLHAVAGRPMLHWVVDACREAGVGRCVIVVGYQGGKVRAMLEGADDCVFVEQTEQLGTAHAVKVTQPAFEGRPATDVFVLAGDGPLIRARTLARMLEVHRRTQAAATLATSVIDDPTGYGRILRDDKQRFLGIVEQKDATPEQLAIREVNPSYYCFRTDALFPALAEVSNNNHAGEFYLTDVPGLLKSKGQTVTVIDAVPPADVLSINTPQQLAEVDRLLRERLAGGSTSSTPAGARDA